MLYHHLLPITQRLEKTNNNYQYFIFVVRMEKIGQLYERSKDDPHIVMVKPETRMVAKYYGEAGEFTASWGELMKINPGDFVVREDNGKYYRIEESVFNDTYEFIQ